MNDDAAEIAAAAARWVVEEGMEYGQAKKRAARDLGLGSRCRMPDNLQVEDSVREYLELFAADTQPSELRSLRELAVQWMRQLHPHRPHLTGAVWRGTATRLNDIHLQLFCDDPKSAEIDLINQGIDYQVGGTQGFRGQSVDVLSLSVLCPALSEHIGLHLTVLDHDDLRGALLPDARGLTTRGDLKSLLRLLENAE
ncbi:MAG: hypothetical protein QM527_10220 [Alphaproteobacteria bacterium]|nr:hypothetical protein [Alphaproteobacteria bacterium]